MTTSGNDSFPTRFTRIDELTRGDHTYLNADDECLFLGEYTARKGWSHSATNSLVANFKKPIKYRNQRGWDYKRQAIEKVAAIFSRNIGRAFDSITLVPVPPSKLRSDPEYDDRLMDMLRLLRSPSGVATDFRELIYQNSLMPAAHDSEQRPPPHEWEKAYAIDETVSDPPPDWLGIVDDLIVTGCRFRAISNLLRARFPNARITGLFIARRVPESIDVEDLFGES